MVLPSLMHQLPAEVILGNTIVVFFLDCLIIYNFKLYIAYYINWLLTAIIYLLFFLSVSDLLDYINPDEELKARELQKKLARAKVQPFVSILC